MVYFFKCYSYNFIVMVKTFERNLVHIWLKKLGIVRRDLGSPFFFFRCESGVAVEGRRKAGDGVAGFAGRLRSSAGRRLSRRDLRNKLRLAASPETQAVQKGLEKIKLSKRKKI